MSCRSLFRWLLLIPCLLATQIAVGLGTDRIVETDGTQLRLLIRQLAADDFALRQTAERELLRHGLDAIPLLAEAARSRDPELSVRAIEILAQLYLTADMTVSEESDRALEQLAEEIENPGSHHAQSALFRLQKVRQTRAIATLRKLGAKIDMAPDRNRIAMDFVLLNDRQMDLNELDKLVANALYSAEIKPEDRARIPQTIGNVFFTDRWTGEVEGLRHLKRLGPLDESFPGTKPLQVYVTTDCPVSMEQIQRVAASLGAGEVQERGPSLGVQGSEFGACYVSSVLPGGAADQAGFIQGDLILGALSIPIVPRDGTDQPVDPTGRSADSKSAQESTAPTVTGEDPVPKAPAAQNSKETHPEPEGPFPPFPPLVPVVPIPPEAEEESRDGPADDLLPGGEQINSFSELVNFCRKQKSGQPVQFIVARLVARPNPERGQASMRMEQIVLNAKLADWNEIDTESGLWRNSGAWAQARQIQPIPFPGAQQIPVFPTPQIPPKAFPPEEKDPSPPPAQLEPVDNAPLPELK